MKFIKNIKKWFKKKKKINEIYNEIKKTPATKLNYKPNKKRFKNISNSIYRGIEILNRLETKEKENIDKFNNEKLIWDLRSLIEKHFSDENKVLKEEIRYLNNLVETKNNTINKLNNKIKEITSKQ
jgi:hypothetical protein